MSYVDDPAYWALRQLRSRRATEVIADAWEQWSGSKPSTVMAELRWTTYRPFKKARVVLRVEVTAADGAKRRMDILFAAFASDAAFNEALDTLVSISVPVHVLPPWIIRPWRSIAWVLPHVPRPAALPSLMDPDTIATLLPRVGTAEAVAIDLLRYVPMRRALLRISADGQDYYAKSFSRAEHHRQSTEALELVRGLPVRVPHLLVSAPELNTVIMDHVTGSPLSEFLVDGPLQPLLETGRALATVHRSCLVPGKTRSPIDELKDVEDLLAVDLAPALPKLASRVIDLVGRLKHQLTQLGELEPVPIHGKLFGDQVLYDPAAQDSIAIVDWDDLTGGDPHFDLGRLVAHILFDSQMGARFNPRTRVAALLEGYERAGGKWDHERLRWHVAVALLLRGKISLLRCLAADWEASLETIVIEAESMLAGRSLETGITLVGARRS